jgi:hypothetical protein
LRMPAIFFRLRKLNEWLVKLLLDSLLPAQFLIHSLSYHGWRSRCVATICGGSGKNLPRHTSKCKVRRSCSAIDPGLAVQEALDVWSDHSLAGFRSNAAARASLSGLFWRRVRTNRFLLFLNLKLWAIMIEERRGTVNLVTTSLVGTLVMMSLMSCATFPWDNLGSS